MLMLTHTWLLRSFLADHGLQPDSLDIYVYNVIPDLLPIHGDATSALTHGIGRFSILPMEHRKVAFVRFHLLVDDMAHHGRLMHHAVPEFDAMSQGYTYRKGRFLINDIKALYVNDRKEINGNDALYYAHLIIESAFDLALYNDSKESGHLEMFCNAVRVTADEKSSTLAADMEWLYGIEESTVDSALQEAKQLRTIEKMIPFMSMEGRIPMYANKFGLDRTSSFGDMKRLMEKGRELVRDYRDFIDETRTAIRASGFLRSLQGFFDKS